VEHRKEMKKLKIFTNGCFDLLHVGHVELLKFCENLGDVYVAINSDSSVRRLKGENRPVNNETDRKYMIERLFRVKKVFIFDEATPINLIESLKPDIIVKGGDYRKEQVIGKDLAEVIIFPFIRGYSTSIIIDKVLK
jgi:rfaE bifunctional protein nucleotidyltransferase chain/domain